MDEKEAANQNTDAYGSRQGTLPSVMASVPEAMEGMQLSQQFSGAAHQLQADMDALRLSLDTLNFGGTQALTEASAALRQADKPHGGNHFGPAQEAAQHNTEAHGNAAPAQNDSSDLPAFLSGLRSKYGLHDSTSAQVIEQALRAQATHAAEDLYADANKLLAVRTDQQQDLTQGMVQQDWSALNQRLRDSGFAGMQLQHQLAKHTSQSPQRHFRLQHMQHASTAAPDASSLYSAFDSLLTQYDRRAHLVEELLAATDLSRERESRIDAVLIRLQRERDDAVKAAGRADMQSGKQAEDADLRQNKSSAAVKRLEGDVAKLQSQVATLEHANRLKEQQLKEAKQNAAVVDKGRESAERASESARQAKQKSDSELARLQNLITELDQSKRTKEAELAALAESASQSDRGEQEANKTAAKAQAGAQRLEADIQRLQRYIAHLENTNRAKEHELQQVQRSWSAASQQDSSVNGENERGKMQVKALEGQLRDLHSRLTRLQADSRIRDAENAQLASGMQLSQADKAAAQDAAQRMQTKLEGEVQRLQDNLKELQQSGRERERAVEHWMETASMSSREVDLAEREARKAKEGSTRLEAEVKRLSTQVADLNSSHKQREAEVQEWMESASQSDRGLEDAVSKSNQWKEQARAAESEVQRLQSHICHLEHASRAQEGTLEQLKGRLADKVAKEERCARRDAEAYARLKRAFLINKGDGALRAQSGAVAAAARELRPVEIVGLYEEQNDSMENELAMLRAEVGALAGQLKDAENRAGLVVRSSPYGSGPDAVLSERLAQAETAAAEAQRALHLANTSAAEAARGTARRQAQAEHKADVLAEENASLILELDARPTAKQYKSLQRQMDILERRLNEAKLQAPEAGAAAEGGELELGSKAVGNAPLTTRERMRRDRELHRLGLNLVERIPTDVLIDLVQDVCISLEVTDPTSLPAAVSKLLRVIASLPRLERFVGEVCEAVYHKGQKFVPEQHSQQDPARVPDVLQAWVTALGGLDQAQRIQQAVLHLLNTRPGHSQAKAEHIGLEELVPAVHHLVEYERNSLAAADTIAAAEGVVAAQPDVLLHRIVAQFQHLFDCPRLEGVLPTLNQVYVAYTEVVNFKKSLGDLLGLTSDCTVAACLQRIRHLLDRHGKALDLQQDYLSNPAKRGKENAEPQSKHKKAHGNWPEVEIRVASKPSGQAAQGKSQAQAASPSPKADATHKSTDMEDSEQTQVVEKLLDLLGVAKTDQVIPQTEKIMARLKRLDEVLPKYQGIAGQLYELLKVKGLDDIVPAVNKLVL